MPRFTISSDGYTLDNEQCVEGDYDWRNRVYADGHEVRTVEIILSPSQAQNLIEELREKLVAEAPR